MKIVTTPALFRAFVLSGILALFTTSVWANNGEVVQTPVRCVSVGLGERLCAIEALNGQLWWVDSGGERRTVWMSEFYRLGRWSLSDDGQFLMVEAFEFGGPQSMAVLRTEVLLDEDLAIQPLWQQTYGRGTAHNPESVATPMGWHSGGMLMYEDHGAVSEDCLRFIATQNPRETRAICGEAIGSISSNEEAWKTWRRFSPE
ncbi:hypothetical protein NFC81_09935 [Salinispirillum sp. LH 10-3-1]|uniref:Uncharacterized protein n=1 Tax=Salinispirillum sp. LH 10-3-1 TaxID=2952525 RepID=A0AB38YDA1_9GAMM